MWAKLLVGVERQNKEGEILKVAKGLVCSDDFSQYVAKLVTYSKNDLRATLEYIQSSFPNYRYVLHYIS